jgi:CHAD domain-containing protein
MLDVTDSPHAAAVDHSEVEWQLDADDLDVVDRWLRLPIDHAGLEARSTGRKLVVDHYIDTDDLRLYAAGYAARLRTARGKAEATLKSIVSGGDPESGLRRRLELNEPVRYALLHSLVDARGRVATQIRQHTTVRELRVLFTVRTDRRTYVLAAPSGTEVGEVAIDDTMIEAGNSLAAIRRIEVEALEPAAEEELARFVEVLRVAHRLRPGTSSKFGTGLTLARDAGVVKALPEPLVLSTSQVPSKPAPTSVAASSVPAAAVTAPVPAAPPLPAPEAAPLPDGSLAAFVRSVVNAQLAAIRANEEETRLGEDIEALHDMRVATRRLRTALRLFGAALPAEAAAEVNDGLRWLAAELGVVRDLDVQLERLTELRARASDEVPVPGTVIDPEALEPLAGLLEERRVAARARLIESLDSPRLPALYGALERLAVLGLADLPEGVEVPALTALPPILERRFRAFERRARVIDEGEAPAMLLHEARIRAKRLRYAAEFATPLYSGRASALVAAIKRTQDLLGLHQDAEVAIADLRTLAEEGTGRLPTATLFAMGELAQHYRDSQGDQRLELPQAQLAVRRRWRRLRSKLRKRARATEAAR